MSRLCERWRERLSCLLHGHRDLTCAPAYGEFVAGAAGEKELHYCGACGSPTWIAKSHREPRPPTWASSGLIMK